MAIINSYPTVKPTDNDLVLITDTSVEGNPTKTASVGSILSLADSSYIKSDKIQVTTAELRTLNAPVKLLINNPGPDKNIIQVYGVVFEVTGNAALNKLDFPNDLEITNKAFIGTTPFKYVIPQAIANKQATGHYIPDLTAGETSIGAELILQSAAAPTETGTAATTMTIWITYRIYNIQD